MLHQNLEDVERNGGKIQKTVYRFAEKVTRLRVFLASFGGVYVACIYPHAR